MQDVKMTDRKAGRELAGLETAGCEMRDRAGTIEYDTEHYYYSTTLLGGGTEDAGCEND